MPSETFRPFIRGIYHWLKDGNNDDDVINAKKFLGLFGYGRGAAGASCFADQEFIDDIRRFQKDNGLKVDGVIAPGGETEQALGKQLTEKTRLLAEEPALLSEDVHGWQDMDDSWGEGEWDKRCAYQLVHVDGPTCRRLEKTRRKQGRYKHRPGGSANAACWASANERYAYCLRHKTLEGLPPLDTWDH